MLEQHLRQPYQKRFVDPVIHTLSSMMHPHAVTLVAGILGVSIIPALYFGHPLAGLCLLLLSGYCDTVDGTLARYQNSASSFGSAIDILTDRLVEWAVIIGLYLLDPAARSLLSIMMLGSILLCVTSFLIVAIFSNHDGIKSFYYSPGLIERAEAFVFFTLMIAFPEQFNYLSLIFIILVNLTTLIRLYEFKASQKPL